MYYKSMGIISIVLLAMVDYDYKFLTVDVGCQVKISDDGVFVILLIFTLHLTTKSVCQNQELFLLPLIKWKLITCRPQKYHLYLWLMMLSH